MMTDDDDSTTPLVAGDFYTGAFGPSILLILTSPEAGAWLRLVIDARAGAPDQDLVSLVDRLEVSFSAALGDLLLRRVDHRPAKHLVRLDGNQFVWSCTSGEWASLSLLLEPLTEGPGHQYLTDEGLDDALIEVSFGEHQG